MMLRLAVLALMVGAVAVIAFNLPTFVLLLLAALYWGVWFAMIRAERGNR